MTRYAVVLALVFLCSSLAVAQQAWLTPVPAPLWPRNGVIPDRLANRYVFYDRESEELVLSYPANLGTSDFMTDPGPRVTRRIPLPVHVNPRVRVVIARGDGAYHYRYTVSNEPAAAHAIFSWSLMLRGRAEGIASVGQPPLWITNAFRREQQPGAPYYLADGFYLRWSKYMEDEPNGHRTSLAPGATIGEFVVTADRIPSFITALFNSGPPHIVDGEDIPHEVMVQIAPAFAPSFTNRQRITIGPAFPPDTAAADLAAAYLAGIRRLIADGELSGNSAFVRELSQSLESLISSPGTISTLSRPLTPLELEIGSAIRLVFGR